MTTRSTRRPAHLTPRQRKFALAYAASLNGVEAAIAVGYSPRSARFRASKLLANVAVADAVHEALERSLRKAELTVERIDQELARIAFADITRMYGSDGRLLPMEQWPEDLKAAVATLETLERTGKGGVVKKVRMWDKIAALTTAARRLGMLKDQVKLSGTLTLEQLVLESMKPRPEIGGGGTK